MFWLFAFVFVAAVSSVFVGVPVAISRWIELSSSRSLVGAAILAAFLVAGGTATYMNTTLERFARDAHQPIRGLIGRPVPNSGGDHEYTPLGRMYEEHAFVWPFGFGSVAAAIVGTLATLAARHSRRTVAVPVWFAVAASIGFMFTFWICREFTAWDIFI